MAWLGIDDYLVSWIGAALISAGVIVYSLFAYAKNRIRGK